MNILSAGVIPFYRQERKIFFLILRSYKYWDFPKGVVEADEDVFASAQRELQEETGITKVQFPLGKIFIETEPYAKGKVARYYLGEVDSQKVELGVSEELGRPEHHEFRWVTESEASRILSDRLLKVLHWASERLAQES